MSDKRFGRPPEWAVDAGTVLAVLIAHALPFLVTTRTAAPEAGWTPAQYLPVLLISVPLYWRRRYPLVVLSLVLLGSGLYLIPDPDTAPQPIAYGVLVALYSVAEDRRAAVRRGGLAILVAAMLIQVVDVVLHQPSLETASRSILLLVAVWFLGRAVAGRRELTEREREERKREAGRAAVRERERIARDMHDILGHTVSLMVVQAESGPLAVENNPARAVAAFDAIADTGRTAMDQVRSLVNLWQSGELPGLVDIPNLVKSAHEAGAKEARLVVFEDGVVSAQAGAVAHRVVQEALTNFLRHSEGSVAEVAVRVAGRRVTVSVDDNGGAEKVVEGNGLRNLRDRVESGGGEFRVASHGGFSVTAEIGEPS
ncbi:sensor histidine kinase [Haloglycomyces albus]|uniref:sensor histidine kinase n=1 Tax=Haloglycomyces albus TaxID=526067 RepID=UPI00046D73B3|nr:histidine kinase [Haloglycomyces albus]